ncbi:MAG: TIGR04282 family arsenosugar biosynthesis glycosyltransferase [Ginsengibacter sp.]
MERSSALIIFVRNPVLGKVKTRLAQALGAEKALVIYKKLLKHTHDIVIGVEADKFLYYADYVNHEDIWENNVFKKDLQLEFELGERMKNSIGNLFDKGYSKVGIIGSDCYDLTSEIIQEGIDQLDKHDVVIGPAKDGGYYFMGMNSYFPELFDGKKWSTDTVLKDTFEQLKQMNVTYFKLPVLSDIDHAEDINFKF